MPINGNDLDEEDQIQDEDLQPAPAQQVYLPPTPPPVTPPPLTPPVSPGDLPRSMRPPVQQAPGGFNLELWREQNAQMPIAQAEQAVASAMRFQGIRQYQQDLASGMTAAEALAKSAPLLFGGPKQGNLGQAAAFIRATQPKLPPQITPYQQAQLELRRKELEKKYRGVRSGPVALSKQISALQAQLDQIPLKEGEQFPTGSLADDLRDQIFSLRGYLSPGPARAYGRSTTTPVSPARPPTVTTQEQYDRLAPGTVYISKNGRPHRKP